MPNRSESGRFAFVAWKHGDSVEMEPNPYYWRGEPKLRHVMYKLVASRDTVLAQMRSGEVDLWPGVPPTYVHQVSAIRGARLDSTTTLFQADGRTSTAPRGENAASISPTISVCGTGGVRRKTMAFGIPGNTQPSQPATTQGANPIDQLRLPDPNTPGGPSLACPASMAPDSVKRSDAPPSVTYDADALHRAAAGAHAITASVTAVTVGAAEGLGPALGRLGPKAAAAAGSAARAALPVAGETLGAGGLVIAIQSPAGESEGGLAKTRALDAAGHQRLGSIAHPDAAKPQNTTFPGQRVDVGANHTTLPAHVRAVKDGILTMPAEPQRKPAHTGHASPDLRELTKPTGTTIHRPSAADQATLAKQEKIVTPAHAAHLTPSGNLVNADKAVIPSEKLTKYALDPDHPRGGDKARVFKAALGYDRSNYGDLDKQIREGIQREHAEPGISNEYGSQFSVDIAVTGPAGSAIVGPDGYMTTAPTFHASPRPL